MSVFAPLELYDMLASALLSDHQVYRWCPNDGANPFERMVKQVSDSVVTGDSIAVISQLVAAGHRVMIFPWRRGWTSPSGLLRTLTRRAHGRNIKDLAAFQDRLSRRQLAAELDDEADFEWVTPHAGLQEMLFGRLRAFLR